MKRPIIEPCVPTLVAKPPQGSQWIHEIKHDGYRLIARKRDDRVHLFRRRGYDSTKRYPLIREAMALLRRATAVIDGEVVCCDESRVAVFDRLHSRAYDDRAFLYAFDLLELDGEDWRPRPLDERKAKLEHLLARVRAGIRFNEHMAGDGAMIFAHACQMGFEGIVSKHRLRAYRSGPSKVWLKIKNPSACCASKTGLDMSDQIIRAVLYCDYRAADAEHPEERDQFLSLAQEYRKLAAREATRLAFEMPKRPAAPSLRRDAAARRRA